MKCNASGCENEGVMLGTFADLPLNYCYNHRIIGFNFINSSFGIKRQKKIPISYFEDKFKEISIKSSILMPKDITEKVVN